MNLNWEVIGKSQEGWIDDLQMGKKKYLPDAESSCLDRPRADAGTANI